MSSWRKIHPSVHVFLDSCNVYAVEGAEGGWLIVNAGTGAAVQDLPQLGSPGEMLLLVTHHFRDHAAGWAGFRAAGAAVAAPWHERHHLGGAQSAMREKPVQFLYDLTWDHYAPLEPLEVDRWLHDYEQLTFAGLSVEVVPTPGATVGAASYLVTLPNGEKLAFVGELMSHPGKVPRLSPLQYNYNDLTGLENVLLSWDRLVAAGPTTAFPSLGEPFGDLGAAGELLRQRAAAFESVQPGLAARIATRARDEVEEVVPRLYRAVSASAETHFIVSRSGKVLALDYGYNTAAVRFPARLAAWTRRPLLHSSESLRAKTGATRIDTVIPTHYHDDHVVGVPLLQRLQGTELWAAENFADLLERPADFDRPCLWPEPMRVTRRLPLGEKFRWEDVEITLHPMSGHTQFSCLVLLEFDGRRVAHTGDQLFFLDPATNQLTGPENGQAFTNHVYRNGLALGCYREFAERLRDFRPELILSGHAKPYSASETFWARLEAAAQDFDTAHAAILSIGADEIHFGADGTAAKLFPYELQVDRGVARVALTGWARNPLGENTLMRVRLVTSRAGWSGTALNLLVQPREERTFALELNLPAGECCHRVPIALELSAGGRRFGQVAEAWVTVG